MGNRNNDINIKEALKEAKTNEETTERVGSIDSWMNNEEEIDIVESTEVDKDEVVVIYEDGEEVPEHTMVDGVAVYEGENPEEIAKILSASNNAEMFNSNINTDEIEMEEEILGVIVNNEDFIKTEVEANEYGVSNDTYSSFNAYIADMDSEINELKKEEISTKEDEDEDYEEDINDDDEDEDYESSNDNESIRNEFMEKYNEVKIIINKSQHGSVLDFTEDEKEKIEMSKKIVIEEIENVSLENIVIKKPKKQKEAKRIIKSVTGLGKANIVLPASGYTAVVTGCSAYELVGFLRQRSTSTETLKTKWSIIYDRIESTSLGKMTFNQFLHKTASIDMETFIYGILCATYPDDDKVDLECRNCKSSFEHNYSISSLIRVEEIGDKMTDLISNAVDNSISKEDALAYHENAPVGNIKRIKLPVSGLIIDMTIQSAYDFINKSTVDLGDDKVETKFEEAAMFSTIVKQILVPDLEANDGSYYQIDKPKDITELIYSINAYDEKLFTKKANDIMSDCTFTYGFMDINCPNCGHFTKTIPMSIENILFQKYQQNLSEVE